MPKVVRAGLVIYLMDVCNWKDDCRHYHQSNGYRLFDKGHLHDVKIHKACASSYSCGSKMYQADFPEGDAVPGLGASEHRWEDHIRGFECTGKV